MIYSRDVPAGDQAAFDATVAHVRDYLAAALDPNDDPSRRAWRVIISTSTLADGRIRITGEVDGEPDAPYMKDGYSPDAAAEVGR